MYTVYILFVWSVDILMFSFLNFLNDFVFANNTTHVTKTSDEL